METVKGVSVSQEEIDSFFSDIKCGHIKIEKELTDFQKSIIVLSYEKGYNKEETSKKLGISEKRMRVYYEEYKKLKS